MILCIVASLGSYILYGGGLTLFSKTSNLAFRGSNWLCDVNDKIVIKKYANRRLYDTDSSAYITYSGLGELLSKGHKIKVIDAKSGNDITSVTLSHLISEHVSTDIGRISPNLLQRILQLSLSRDSQQFENFLNKCLDFFETHANSDDAVNEQSLNSALKRSFEEAKKTSSLHSSKSKSDSTCSTRRTDPLREDNKTVVSSSNGAREDELNKLRAEVQRIAQQLESFSTQ